MSVPRISKEDLQQRLSGDAVDRPVIVDVRLKYPYEHSTITLPGAVRLLPDAAGTADLPRDHDLVLYDSDPGEIVAERAAAALIARGHRAFALTGGISDWATAKLPTDTKSAPQASSAPGAGAPKG